MRRPVISFVSCSSDAFDAATKLAELRSATIETFTKSAGPGLHARTRACTRPAMSCLSKCSLLASSLKTDRGCAAHDHPSSRPHFAALAMSMARLDCSRVPCSPSQTPLHSVQPSAPTFHPMSPSLVARSKLQTPSTRRTRRPPAATSTSYPPTCSPALPPPSRLLMPPPSTRMLLPNPLPLLRTTMRIWQVYAGRVPTAFRL